QVRALVDDLAAKGVDINLGRDKAKEAYEAAKGSISAKTTVWTDAIKLRKQLAKAPAPESNPDGSEND
ncbi:hypothetical protein, partial [Mycolicibacterium mageritense]|uniref:hypothetical protein n=1 Tax=Mycolicibacterium mageritense TaxID=53462 RepID=UPI001E577854